MKPLGRILTGAALVVAALIVGGLLLLGGGDAEAGPTPPPTCTAPGAAPRQPAAPRDYAGVTLSPSQMDAARAIVGVAKGLSISRRGVIIAVQAAMQESTLNPAAENGNALGLFQQIAPGPFNAYAGYDRHDPEPAARGFFAVLAKRVPGYETDSRPNHELAEEVERSGEGHRYQGWQAFAEAVAGALLTGSGNGGLRCTDRSVKGRVPVTVRGTEVDLPAQSSYSGVVVTAHPRIAAALAAGLSWLGTTYAWGGGDANGPTKGTRDGGVADEHGDYTKVGFDCSGLTLYSYAQVGVTLVRPSSAQRTTAEVVVPFAQARAGDLLFWGTHHVALYLGKVAGQDLMLEAPSSGDVVKVSPVRVGSGDFRDVGARPIPEGR
ncbi:C40 family peptidase [Actinokineospora cianjurensis]|uniref:NlpC/P60 family protein n=1 Tax=Actinokineospora cianjurensis TaxID=585224 RepID=A0A421B266_9PSEU|nr:C40 family peptidase [Actinokineospora cianjurensis]RLK58363.1 NlpC/P60 family protein [Actinokineospora cianjurensis]